MNIQVISRQQAIECTSRSLHLLEHVPSGELSLALVGQAIRRAVNILAPCAKHELEQSVRHSLEGFGHKIETVQALTEFSLEASIVYGDILEMRAGPQADWAVGKYVLRPAAPAFVQRSDGTIYILGVGGDVITPLTKEFLDRLVYFDTLRILSPMEGEALGESLQELGLIKLDESSWLRVPSKETDKAHISAWQKRLEAQQNSSDIEGLIICDEKGANGFYPDRWVTPASRHTGLYVARRPQRYGAANWCLVKLQSGVVTRFVDLFSPGDRSRACDVAWRVQMAIDSASGTPQIFSRGNDSGVDTFKFFSPIPCWAERRLALSGRRVKISGCLLSYEVPPRLAEAESTFLRDTLWLRAVNEADRGGNL